MEPELMVSSLANAPRLTSDLLMVKEMARNLTIRGTALIEQAEKVMASFPGWDEA